ncbi:MAG: GNAT family N-acetyltransferase [Hyphomicrobiaceae bacterium]
MSSDLEIRPISENDLAAISALHASAFGPGRYARTAYRVREGTPLVTPHCRAAYLDGTLVAALRFTPVSIGGVGGALLLGPVAVEPASKGRSFGKALIARSIEDATHDGFRLILLVGDLPYYARFGFVRIPPGQIALPGPVNPERFLARELVEGALAGYRGLVIAD